MAAALPLQKQAASPTAQPSLGAGVGLGPGWAGEEGAAGEGLGCAGAGLAGLGLGLAGCTAGEGLAGLGLAGLGLGLHDGQSRRTVRKDH